MNKYIEFKDRKTKEVNAFPMGFAYSNKQLEEELQRLGATINEVVSIGVGGFIKKSDVRAFNQMFENLVREQQELMKDDEFVIQMFEYELGNHEFCITYDYDDTLKSCGLKFDELDERMLGLLKTARDNYLKGCECEW